MTKLEELTALLVNEIDYFNQGVEKLDKINIQLKETKIKMDLIEYKTIIETHEQKMEDHKNIIERFEKRFENKIKHAKIYPTWAVVLFIVGVLFGVVSFLFILIK